MTRDATTTKTTVCATRGQAKSLRLACHSVPDKREVRDNYCGIQSLSLSALQLAPRHDRAFLCTGFSKHTATQLVSFSFSLQFTYKDSNYSIYICL